MSGDFERFGLAHLVVLATVPALGSVLSAAVRRDRRAAAPIRFGLGGLLLAIEAGWFASIILQGEFALDYGLPLQLTDTTALLTVLVAMTLNQRVFDITYYWAMTAMPMAMLTPDLPDPFPNVYTILFFLVHGLSVVIVLFLLWTGTMRPGANSMWRSFAALNGFTVLVLAFNALFGTNYMYLMEKPAQGSLLDYLGPWPAYILAGDALALCLFALLSLPYRRAGTGRR